MACDMHVGSFKYRTRHVFCLLSFLPKLETTQSPEGYIPECPFAKHYLKKTIEL